MFQGYKKNAFQKSKPPDFSQEYNFSKLFFFQLKTLNFAAVCEFNLFHLYFNFCHF